MKNELLGAGDLPAWVSYPPEFLQLIASEDLNIGPWQILTGKWLQVRHQGLKKRFPERDLVPFARRVDNDDIACWEAEWPSRVQVIHDFSAPGWESRNEHESFAAWLKRAKDDAEGYEES